MLYLVRHASAVSSLDDAVRELSVQGRQEAQRIAQFLARSRSFSAREFWHSPLIRAKQTAEIFAESFPGAVLRSAPGFLPEDDPAAVVPTLAAAVKDRPIAVFGHEPFLGRLATLLVSGRTDPVAFHVRKASVFAFSPAPFTTDALEAPWVTQWHVSPVLLTDG